MYINDQTFFIIFPIFIQNGQWKKLSLFVKNGIGLYNINYYYFNIIIINNTTYSCHSTNALRLNRHTSIYFKHHFIFIGRCPLFCKDHFVQNVLNAFGHKSADLTGNLNGQTILKTK